MEWGGNGQYAMTALNVRSVGANVGFNHPTFNGANVTLVQIYANAMLENQQQLASCMC
jgi:hypothetical protein